MIESTKEHIGRAILMTAGAISFGAVSVGFFPTTLPAMGMILTLPLCIGTFHKTSKRMAGLICSYLGLTSSIFLAGQTIAAIIRDAKPEITWAAMPLLITLLAISAFLLWGLYWQVCGLNWQKTSVEILLLFRLSGQHGMEEKWGSSGWRSFSPPSPSPCGVSA